MRTAAITIRVKHRSAVATVTARPVPCTEWPEIRRSTLARITVNGLAFTVKRSGPFWNPKAVMGGVFFGYLYPWDSPGDARSALHAVMRRAIRKWPWLKKSFEVILSWPVAFFPSGSLIGLQRYEENSKWAEALRKRGHFVFERADGTVVTNQPYSDALYDQPNRIIALSRRFA